MPQKEKHIAKIFMLLASIVLLAHTIIPHHHHKEQVCFETHCINDEMHNGQAHDHAEHNHQHDNKNTPNSCCVSEFIPVSPNNTLRSDSFQNLGAKHLIDFHFSLFTSSTQISIPLTKTIAFDPGFVPHFSFIIHSSLGLRAPPVF